MNNGSEQQQHLVSSSPANVAGAIAKEDVLDIYTVPTKGPSDEKEPAQKKKNQLKRRSSIRSTSAKTTSRLSRSKILFTTIPFLPSVPPRFVEEASIRCHLRSKMVLVLPNLVVGFRVRIESIRHQPARLKGEHAYPSNVTRICSSTRIIMFTRRWAIVILKKMMRMRTLTRCLRI